MVSIIPATGPRAQMFRMRSEHPNQLDYSGFEILRFIFFTDQKSQAEFAVSNPNSLVYFADLQFGIKSRPPVE